MKVWIAELTASEGLYKRAGGTRKEARAAINADFPVDEVRGRITFETRDLPGVGRLTLEKVVDLVNYMASSTEGAN